MCTTSGSCRAGSHPRLCSSRRARCHLFRVAQPQPSASSAWLLHLAPCPQGLPGLRSPQGCVWVVVLSRPSPGRSAQPGPAQALAVRARASPWLRCVQAPTGTSRGLLRGLVGGGLSEAPLVGPVLPSLASRCLAADGDCRHTLVQCPAQPVVGSQPPDTACLSSCSSRMSPPLSVSSPGP